MTYGTLPATGGGVGALGANNGGFGNPGLLAYTFATLPEAGPAGNQIYCTDQGLCISNGTAWVPIGTGGGGGNLPFSSLPAAATVQNTDVLPLNQTGSNVQSTVGSVGAIIVGPLTATVAANASTAAAATATVAANLATNVTATTAAQSTATTALTNAATANTAIGVTNGNVATNTSSIATLTTNLAAISPPALVANSTSAATANTSIIQSLLNIGGVINLTVSGTIWINATLIGSSNTTLICGPLTHIEMMPSISLPLLMYSSLVTMAAGSYTTLTGGAAVTLTQGTGAAVNVALTAHGLSVGDGYWIVGSTVSTYNGVFRVASIVDANNFTIYTHRVAPSAPSGTTLGTKAVSNFNLIGGLWDYNGPNQTSAANAAMHGIILFGGIDCTIDDVKVINCIKYSFMFGHSLNQRFRNIKFINYVSDGIKIYGPCVAMNGDGAAGVAFDDFMSIQTKDGTGFTAYQFNAWGDCWDITLKNFVCTTTAVSTPSFTTPVHIYPSDNEVMDNIHIEQVSGSSTAAAVNIVRGSGFTVGNIGRLKLTNIQTLANTVSTAEMTAAACTIDQLLIEDCSISPGIPTSSYAFFIGGASSALIVNELIFQRIKCNGYALTGGSGVLVNIAGAQLKNVIFRDWDVVNGVAGSLTILQMSSTNNTLESVLFDGGKYDSTVTALLGWQNLLASGTPNVALENVNFTGTNCIGYSGVGANVNFNLAIGKGCRLTPSGAVVRCSQTATINIRSDGSNTISGTLINPASGTVTASLYGNDLVYDVGLLTLTPGQYCQHSSAISGRNSAAVQGLSYTTAASGANHWYANYALAAPPTATV